MRIAFVSTILNFPWGGADALWTVAAERAAESGHSLLLSVAPAVATHPRLQALQARGAQLQLRPGNTADQGQRKRLQETWRRLTGDSASLLVALDRFRPDFVYLSQGGTADFLLEAGLLAWLREHSVPYAIICQSNDDREEVAPELRDQVRGVMTSARRMIFVSSHNRDLMFRQLGAPLNNALVVPNPVELGAAPLPLPWPAAPSARFAVVVRLEINAKGLDLLLEALARLPAQSLWQVDLFGRGPDEAALRQRTTELGLDSRVSFRGYASDVRAIWAEHHCLVLASRREGCALAMLEALACGRPVLSTEVGGARDWIEPGRNGWICAREDVNALTATLAQALEQFPRWPVMGAASAELMKQRNSMRPADLVLGVALS